MGLYKTCNIPISDASIRGSYGTVPNTYHPHIEESEIIWYWYGADPYHSHARHCGKSMELCQIRSNTIVKDKRIKTE